MNDNKVDDYCLEICKALSEIEGVEIISGSCGWGKEPLNITFHVSDLFTLSIITRAINERYLKSRAGYILYTVPDDLRLPKVDVVLSSTRPYIGEPELLSDIGLLIENLRYWNLPDNYDYFTVL